MHNDTLVERLRSHAGSRPDALALRFLEGDAVATELTFTQLDARIRALAARLQQLGGVGERAVILLPTGANYVTAFYACLYAGVIAVPAYPPDGTDRYAGRLNGILRDATPRFILTESHQQAGIEALLSDAPGVHVLHLDTFPFVGADDWQPGSIEDAAVAFLQYTSGSTSQPKGVCVTQANLAANAVAIDVAHNSTHDDIFVSWLPLYHDMGLIGGLISPLYKGIPSVLMSPRNFLERPRRWLEAIARHGGTISGGPDFAFALCADRVSDESLSQLDLSRWRVAFSGSEFVRPQTLERFAARFAMAGFDRRALTPCYGLAEATLFVAGGCRTDGPVSLAIESVALTEGRVVEVAAAEPASQVSELAFCGRPAPAHAVRIMRTDGSGEQALDTIGEIWVAGPSLAQGYWNNPEATQAVFVTDNGVRWLRTGDLGFLRDGLLVVTGRLKDLLIVRGQNVYPFDIEQAVESEVTSVRSGRVAVFPVQVEGREGIGVAAEFSRSTLKRLAPEQLAGEISDAVVRQCQEHPAVVVLLNPQGMPLTTSGKRQRSACSARWATGELDSFMVFENGRPRGEAAPERTGTAPATEQEQAIGAIWCDALGVERVWLEDDFFALGGNSIAAGQVASAIRDSFDVELELRSFFDTPVLAAFAAHVATLMQTKTTVVPQVVQTTGENRLLLSHAQERLWFLWNMDPASTAYTVAGAIRLTGALDPQALAQAVTEIVRRHEVLRTTFLAHEGRGMQVIHDALPAPFAQTDLGRHPEAARVAMAATLTKEELAKPFDLVQGPLLRVNLLRFADTDHELLLLAHHIVVDGWSLNVLLDELAGLYRGFVQGHAVPSAELAIQYADYAAWQRAWLSAGEGERQLAYWRAQLSDSHPVLALPLDRPRPRVQSHHGDTLELHIDAALAAQLRALAGRHQASVFMLLLAAYQTLLYRYTGQTDLRIGVPVAGRRHAQVERLIGFFVNTLVLRAEIADDIAFPALLRQAKDAVIAALAHQDLPFEMLVDGLQPDRSTSHNPLFQAKFNYMAAPRGFAAVDGIAAETRIIDLAGSHFDLALDIVDGPKGMRATFNYATDLFDAPTISRMATQFGALLRQVAEDASRQLSSFTIEASHRQTVAAETAAFAFDDILALREAATTDRPSAIALRCGNEVLTVADLARQSNLIAQRLIAEGVTREQPVALWIERSITFVAALLGVLKAGGTYVPLDPKWPVERVQQVLRDGRIGIVLAAGETLPQARTLDGVVLDLDAPATLDGLPTTSPAVAIHPAQSAYVIYTSGSTGKPKGVAVSHGALANYVQALLRRLQPAPGASMAMVSTVAADLGHTVLFGALASGATLHLLPPDKVFDADAFAQAMRDGEVGILKIVPSHLRGLLQASRSVDLLPRDVLVLGGEACDPALVEEVRRLRPHCRIINHYGPTETTVGVLTHECDVVDASLQIPVGLPLANLSAYVLDDALNEVPIGVTGELFIGGAGLARGYRRAPHLTAERFVPDPFGAPGERLYRTGDLVRCDQDGRLIFLGRGDDQVKLRGYRIELGEVGRVLKALDGVADAIALVRNVADGEDRQHLVAYCVPGAGAALDAEAIKQQLAMVLPDYMVPARIMLLERLPLTANGKVDRKALPVPDLDVAAKAYAAPQGEVEQAISAVWGEVLGRDQIGRDDNFFELGGDSILSLQIIARLRKRGLKLTPKQVFERQTIAGLAEIAAKVAPPAARKTGKAPSDEAKVAGPHTLLPIQLKFFGEDAGERHHWNQAVLLQPKDRLDWNVLGRALEAVVAHHDALRLRFAETNGVWSAEHGAAPVASELLWVRDRIKAATEVTAVASSAQASLSLSLGPLLRAVGMDLIDGSQRLLVAIHHLVVDGVSWRVLLEDVAAAYGQLVSGATVTLPPKSQPYASWGARLQVYAGTDELAAQLPYWQARRSETRLPCDDDHGGIDRVADTEEVSLVVDAALTSRLLKDAPSAYRTQVNDLLLAALARSLRQWSGLDEVLVELEGHGREDVFAGAEVSRTVGWFTTLFPVRLKGGALDDAALIKTVKEELRGVPGRGLGYGVLRYLGSDTQRQALSAIDDPRIVFNYLGQFDSSLGEGAAFAVARESAGPMRSAAAPLGRWLSINGQVRDGRLQLSFGYGRKRYQRATIERLAEAYGSALRQLVAHCTGGASGVTPSDVALSGLNQSELDSLQLDWRTIEDVYPLSPMQQGMLFHALRDAESGVYVNQVALEIRGLDASKLRIAWQAVSSRHAVLRTGFVWQGLSGTAQQVVHRQVEVPFTEEDWRERAATLDRPELDAALAEASRAERAQGFDLSQPPLQRVRLIHLGDNNHWLIWTYHHVLLDGWSSARLVAEVLQHEGGETLPAVQGRYRDYIGWLEARDRDASAKFWRDALAALEQPSLLADALERPADGQRSGHGSLPLLLDTDLTGRLQAFAKRERVTLNTLVQGAWAQLLRRYTGQHAVSFGATVSGRPEELTGSEEMVGLFINTLPVVDSASSQTKVGAWLRTLQEQNLALREFGWTPLYEIQRLAGRSGRALFDSILVFENYPIDQALRGKDGETPRFGRVEHISTTNYPMTVAVFAAADTINLGFRFDRSRFDDGQVEDLRRSFQHFLERMIDNAEQALGDLGALEDASQVLAWSGAVDRLPSSAFVFRDGIVAQIEVRAVQAPSVTALVFGDRSLSYGELNARANRLARRLRAHGIGPDRLVGLALERSFELIVAVVAVLKAGGAYLPLDPDYPAERLAHMLRDSGTSLVLTHGHVEDRLTQVLAETSVEAWMLDDRQQDEGTDGSNLDLSIHPDSLAYVIYTSGSTGIPKGVGCSHGALAGRLGWMQAEYGLKASETLLQKTPVSFDVSVWELFWPLAAGARLAIAAPGAHREPRQLVEAIRKHSVSTLHFVPQMLEQFVAEPEARDCVSLSRLFSGGEALSTALQARVLAAFPKVRFDNRYGPTEATINATYWTCRDDGRRVPIGPPIPGTVTRILDADLNPLPAGVAGELYLGGVGLARGYQGRAGLTAERFIPDPFGGSGDRLYRTGDLARWRADGAIEYVGRSDHQVKIRGFRIELGEIEARLLQQAGVRTAVVVARETGANRQLVGYVSGEDGLDGAQLRTALSPVLPDYMVPARIVVLERLPLMPNGKVDRRALPEPEAVAAGSEHVAPRTPVESSLAAIWAQLLGQEAVSVTDNFFELGGDSITAIRLVAHVREQLKSTISLREVFESGSIERLARRIEGDNGGASEAADVDKIDALLSSLEAAAE
ncbi:non-ribosomal peptide synthetase [Bradyrhizobium prioriisuperbiae]|uniref:non-ribosomal peptide synthetase n=1 Tax=Bradyrhizobium prioriisuperbiae TaxID=2854389 RepID=UPI0028E67109|nr:non-ribosomal peptide synthetase [Bradyrhizobium prioritasuperba]